MNAFPMKSIFIGITLIIFNLSCKDDHGTGTENNDFYLKVTVKDINNHLISGLRVSGWNRITGDTYSMKQTRKNQTLSNITAFTTIEFDAPIEFKGSLTVFDLKNNQIAVLFDKELFDPGCLEVEWPAENLPSGVYRIQFTAINPINDSLLYRQYIYASLDHRQVDRNVLGFTSNNGDFISREKILFPVLFNLPSINRRDEFNNDLGTFTYSDSIVIILTDTIKHQQQIYKRKIINGPNDFSLIWQPTIECRPFPDTFLQTTNQFDTVKLRYKLTKPDSIILPPPEPLPTKFWLYQNYPNPFSPVTTIVYTLPKSMHVKLVVYDVLGRELITLIDGIQDAGYYSVVFNASSVSSGVYLYKLIAGKLTLVKRMIVIQ
ncbi:MAG: T9SS type A sorting domain-containing protein [Bacteroidota bacterium]|nr:T9SS type A sorting domain-containing protein [Bacteroidota bacterium]